MEKSHVDEIVSHVPGTFKKIAIVGFSPMPMWMGVVGSGRELRETCRGPSINKEGCLRERTLSP